MAEVPCPECEALMFLDDFWTAERVRSERERVARMTDEQIQEAACGRHLAILQEFVKWARPMLDRDGRITASGLFAPPSWTAPTEGS